MITVVQSSGEQTGSGSLSITLNGVAQGNTIVVVTAIYKAAGMNPCQGVVSDGSGTYSQDAYQQAPTSVGPFSSTTQVSVHRLSNASSGSHVISVGATGCTITALALELTSSYTPNRIFKDVSNQASGSSTSPAVSATATTTVAESYSIAALAAAGSSSQASITVGTSPIAWTELVEHLATSGATPAEFDSFTASARGTVSAGWTLASSVVWAACVVTYSEVFS